ncbi:MAG: hypothetical protein A3I88_02110 [Candidatus Portnoybacteria bacterium RIFCSPLOWO2_12_FULL_39_9]|uniref:PEGA domain-containing protein n=1 Tax=Candidatus Portnoybacteria bacterium RIFCSPHIGHO2_12_FULL_38_9 TaxID=1801997 RepID=A0A1G2FEP0_9BACT|nr:MAG: hypothetical protein A3H00_01010 [Candidatus Portnoybacteria bacterium RBG_13_40_8]OGZ36161.1 MAG: hypothetical protein A2646_01030 [Candidatus Portnoybacteria bacterium RIFCSPHIGHO2_02_FULL_39_12]OGZ36519.1 MAG: hypothetical protein A3J64_02755 [Candidatus Portnoybacteria bacterium RIFCSPHIGHO2_12_FULL_38_9]OGZ38528.1 MAG: hypothetical protein A3F21_02265 [Candidatus Portnoybacteria bacterium RIFCSPLOWO2_01_FULL_38_39]OGZ41293.1 MAG: hypothetical protein A3I88_02110 [Candidatus Portnoy
MNKQTRRLLLASLIIIFLLAAPAVLFYAWGYSFDWQNKKPVITGGIYLESIPKKAEIYLDGRLKNHTPRLLKRLVPKEYQIKLIKEGYYSWQKKLKVESQLVTEARNILLLPQAPEIELIDDNLTENFSLQSLFPKKEKEIFELQEPSYILYKSNPERTAQTQISVAPLPLNQTYQIIVSPNQNLAALSEQGKLYLFNPEKKIFEELAENIKGAQFSDDDKKILYFSQSEIWVAYLKDNLIQPYKKAGEKELITRLSQEIKQAIWYPKTNEHIILAVGQVIKIIELDNRDIRNITDFIETQASQIAYDAKTEKLYFVEGEKLYNVSLKE